MPTSAEGALCSAQWYPSWVAERAEPKSAICAHCAVELGCLKLLALWESAWQGCHCKHFTPAIWSGMNLRDC